jgi:EAL domain-containing protein (putative c-di-GMP-specific phosphodiesterase class I)
MRSRLLRDRALTKALTTALEDNALDVHYQPIVSLEDGNMLALEALARWNHPQWGWISPNEFIPLAEDQGLIVGLGQFVLDEAVKQASVWRTEYPNALPLGIIAATLPARLRRRLHSHP